MLENNPSYHPNPDLLLRFSQGQENAFATLYDQFYDRVYGFTKRWISEPGDAEDIVAETFIKLWNGRMKFESMDHLGAFLYVTVRNQCLNFLRQAQRSAARETQFQREISDSNENDFANMEVRAEFLKMIYAKVDEMPSKMKEIFLLSYRDGLTATQIAERLDLKVQTVKNQKCNAINLLKLALHDKPILLAFLLYLEMHSTVAVPFYA